MAVSTVLNSNRLFLELRERPLPAHSAATSNTLPQVRLVETPDRECVAVLTESSDLARRAERTLLKNTAHTHIGSFTLRENDRPATSTPLPKTRKNARHHQHVSNSIHSPARSPHPDFDHMPVFAAYLDHNLKLDRTRRPQCAPPEELAEQQNAQFNRQQLQIRKCFVRSGD